MHLWMQLSFLPATTVQTVPARHFRGTSTDGPWSLRGRMTVLTRPHGSVEGKGVRGYSSVTAEARPVICRPGSGLIGDNLPTARAPTELPALPLASQPGCANWRSSAESPEDDALRGRADLARRPPRPGRREGQHARAAARGHRPADHRRGGLAHRLSLLPLRDPDPAYR